ncbi:HPP family-domain-containing protein [Halteromyces radiatus]|uniref:HPP family-domain-containing protein n=1 Tax=Halteromyces radiatus TaxID=101107 RepID=UPI00221F8BF4|nr:HPP family-domain-containing protein [Halteromyces radiatus]KAI8097668.1 HPP family-domain-containing protein [Halteromyces radiatus]
MWTLANLPSYFSRWLGYRDPSLPLKNHKRWQISFWSFIGAWLGIAVLLIIGTYSPQLAEYHSPTVIASFGASAVLLYGSIDSPLAQPRNAFFGHVIGALVGVSISKLFIQVPTSWASPEQQVIVQWVAGATAVSLAIVVMQMTTTVHPPGGATALLPAVDSKVIAMGWYYIGVVAMSAAVQLVLACLVNNMDRRYPTFWWRPARLPVQIDPGNLATALPFSQRGDDVVVNVDDDRTSSSTNVSSGLVILLDPAHPLVLPPDILNADDMDALKSIHAKLRASSQEKSD